MNVPERIVPDATEPGIVALHLKRYEFARPYCASKTVLDAGCGVGYGAAYLAEVAAHVVGVDASQEAVAYARARYAKANVEFAVGDVTALTHREASFDVVCAFEVIEHVPRPERLVAEARRVLRDGGVLIASTPRATSPGAAPENPFHEREFTAEEFRALLTPEFDDVEMFGQRRLQTTRHRALQSIDVLGLRKRVPLLRRASRALTGTPSMDAVASDGIVITREGIDAATELVAVCR